MVNLPNGCRRSELNVKPSNWKSSKAKISVTWYADCYFFDPRYQDKYPRGKQIRLKAGVNRLTSLEERRTMLNDLMDKCILSLAGGFNPISDSNIKSFTEVNCDDTNAKFIEVLPSTPFILSLRFALENSRNVHETKADIRSIVNSIEKAAIALGYENLPIGDIQVKHIKRCLDYCLNNFEQFSEKRFNKGKAYLSGLFRYLVQMGAASGNAPRNVMPLEVLSKERAILTPQKVKLVKEHLWAYNRPFYKFMMIFFYSGGRVKELMTLKGKDVNLVEQTYRCLVKKGKKRVVTRTIRTVASSFWKEQMENCNPDDYVFSKDLLPGTEFISSRQVTIRWKKHVKIPLNIKEDFYTLKHLNTDRTIAALSLKAAAGQAGHTSTRMAEEVYGFDQAKRIHQQLKDLDIEL